jgi:hypothetical protein
MAFQFSATILLFFFGVIFLLVYLNLPQVVATNEILNLMFVFAPIIMFALAIYTIMRD